MNNHKPRLFADFHNADRLGRLRLNCVGTVEDLSRRKVTLVDGLQVTLYSEDLEVEGSVVVSSDEGIWVAVIDWDAIRRVPACESTEEQVG